MYSCSICRVCNFMKVHRICCSGACTNIFFLPVPEDHVETTSLKEEEKNKIVKKLFF